MQETLTLPSRDREHERILGIVFDISPSQAAILSCLSRATIVTGDELLEYSNITSQIRVAISRTRTKLKAWGMDIHVKQDVGYYLTPDDKRTIERMVAKFVEGR